MTGPEHYELAEAFAEEAEHARRNLKVAEALAALGQLHATLAVAAATYDANRPERITAP